MPEAQRVRRRGARKQTPGNILEKIRNFLSGDGVPEAAVAGYVTRLERDWAGLLPWLPPSCGSFLDIGCGLGGHAALLAAYYPKATPNLLDGQANRNKQHEDVGFHEAAKPWISAYRAARLISHCCGTESLVWTYPEVMGVGAIACDLVLSIKAWGHHFPIKLYLPLIERSLAAGSCVILDIRNGTNGLEAFAFGFRTLGEIPGESVKSKRFVLGKLEQVPII